MEVSLLFVPLTLWLSAPPAECLPDGLASTPPMGWSSWNTFFGDNDEEKMRGIADAVVDLGLDQFGWVGEGGEGKGKKK